MPQTMFTKAMKTLILAALMSVAILLAGVTTVSAQIPDEFTNLQLLNPEIEKDRLVGTMKNWADGLGVRCNHCHVGPDDLQGMNFASDEKAEKRTARKMLEMSRVINRELMKEIPIAEGRRSMVVSCFTCHRGQTKPKNIPPRIN